MKSFKQEHSDASKAGMSLIVEAMKMQNKYMEKAYKTIVDSGVDVEALEENHYPTDGGKMVILVNGHKAYSVHIVSEYDNGEITVTVKGGYHGSFAHLND